MKFLRTPLAQATPGLLRPTRLAALGAASALAFATPAAANGPLESTALLSETAIDAQFATFVPSDKPNQDKIDYSIWDEAMKNLVISMGPSTRQGANRPDNSFGSRRQYGHVSRYRLEGTRLMFSFLEKDVIASFTEYRQDLEATASQVDIQALSRNEQLAYWINLHNVAMIEQIALAWPVRQPREIEIGGVPIDDAKFITVEGVKLSPRDIREKIVYSNWSDPRVMYGFWRGEIGSPSLQRSAYSADNVSDLLDRSASDFVNSLRGTQKAGSKLQVAELYQEAAPFFFPNFEEDVRAHLAKFANEEVSQILAETSKTEASISEYDIADLAGGVREPNYQNITTNDASISTRIPQSMVRLLAARERKLEKLIREGRTGTVTFTRIDLPDDPDATTEVE